MLLYIYILQLNKYITIHVCIHILVCLHEDQVMCRRPWLMSREDHSRGDSYGDVTS